MSDDEYKEEKELNRTSPEVVTKYKSAAEIINKALHMVVSECKPNVKIVDLCKKADNFITEQTGNMYKNVKKKIERGVAFPTCISINNTVCHFSPLASDETVLVEGDVVKIDMGCHIHGFIAVVAHTYVLQDRPVTGRAADVIAATNTAAELSSFAICEAWNKVPMAAENYYFFNQINTTSEEWAIKVRVERVWEVLDINTRETKSLDFIFSDEHGDQIHGSMAKGIFPELEQCLEEGKTYHLENFTVEEKMRKYYCPVKHRYNTRFKNTTIMHCLQEDGTFPEPKYEFVPFNKLSICD